MFITDAMPNNGQFVALWFTSEGLPFSATLKWEDGQLKSYNNVNDLWECECDHGYSRKFFESRDANFYR